VEQQLGLKPDELINMNSRQRRHFLRRRMREEAAVTEESTTETNPTDDGDDGDDDEARSEMTLTTSNSDLHSVRTNSNMELSGMMELAQELTQELVLKSSCDELEALEGEASSTEPPPQPPPPYKPPTTPPPAT